MVRIGGLVALNRQDDGQVSAAGFEQFSHELVATAMPRLSDNTVSLNYRIACTRRVFGSVGIYVMLRPPSKH
jgi:hypothetical protein